MLISGIKICKKGGRSQWDVRFAALHVARPAQRCLFVIWQYKLFARAWKIPTGPSGVARRRTALCAKAQLTGMIDQAQMYIRLHYILLCNHALAYITLVNTVAWTHIYITTEHKGDGE